MTRNKRAILYLALASFSALPGSLISWLLFGNPSFYLPIAIFIVFIVSLRYRSEVSQMLYGFKI